jgi:dihydroorotate dehydrogenase
MSLRGPLAATLARCALPLLQRLPPEAAHGLALRGLHLVRHAWSPPREGASGPVDVRGLRFRNRVGLAAGFDKNGEYVDALGALGFGHIEIGTVTPRAQSGNPRPRLFRLRSRRALINRMGFNNLGATHAAAALSRSNYRGVLGVSIGKNADTPLERAADDYLECFRRLYAVAGYFAVNVSSPNTQRLRELQAASALGAIVEPLQNERERLAAQHGKRVPIFVKVSPDLAHDELTEFAAELARRRVDGVIATNTSTSLPGFEAELARREGGGVSGAPLTERALAELVQLRRLLGPGFPIIGVGGVMSAADARARLEAGADLIQLYTGFVYRGPALLDEILRAPLP